MPDAHGNFKGMSVPAAAWERIFGNKQPDYADHDTHVRLYREFAGQVNRDNNSTNK